MEQFLSDVTNTKKISPDSINYTWILDEDRSESLRKLRLALGQGMLTTMYMNAVLANAIFHFHYRLSDDLKKLEITVDAVNTFKRWEESLVIDRLKWTLENGPLYGQTKQRSYFENDCRYLVTESESVNGKFTVTRIRSIIENGNVMKLQFILRKFDKDGNEKIKRRLILTRYFNRTGRKMSVPEELSSSSPAESTNNSKHPSKKKSKKTKGWVNNAGLLTGFPSNVDLGDEFKNFCTKILLIGPSGHGKTALLQNLIITSNSKKKKKRKHSSVILEEGLNGLETSKKLTHSASMSSSTASANSSSTVKPPYASDSMTSDGFKDLVYMAKCSKKFSTSEGQKELFLNLLEVQAKDNIPCHHFFISARTVYIIVLSLDMINNCPAAQKGAVTCPITNRWLSSIKSYDRNANIFVVLTHSDGFPGIVEEVAHNLSKNKKIARVIPVDNLSLNGIDNVWTALGSTIFNMPHFGETFNKSFIILDERLNRLREKLEPPVLSWSQFQSLAWESGIRGQDINRAASLLHDLGGIIYKESNFKSVQTQQFVFLDLEWVCKLFCLTFTSSAIENGILDHRFLPVIWKPPKYPPTLYATFLALLENCELLFPVRTGEGDRVPDVSPGVEINMGEVHFPLVQSNSFSSFSSTSSTEDIIDSLATPRGFMEFSLPQVNVNSSKYSIVPHLLPTSPSRDFLETLFEEEQEWKCFGRFYKMEDLAEGFISNMILRVHSMAASDPTLKVLDRFRYGVLLYGECAKGHGYAAILANVETGLIRVVGKRFYWAYFAILGVLHNMISQLEIPEKAVESVWIPAVDSTCVESIDDPKATLIPIQTIFAALSARHDTVKLEGKDMEFQLPYLVPDLCLLAFHDIKVKYNEIELYEEIGKGGYATVYRAKIKDQIVAVKQLHFLELEGTVMNKIMLYHDFTQEMVMMRHVHGEGLVNLVAVCSAPPIMALELCPAGDLRKLIDNYGTRFSRDHILNILIDISNGIHCMHKRTPPVVHRDLKTPNVLVISTDLNGPGPYVKVCDLGTATEQCHVMTDRPVDNPLWLAPEVLKHNEYSTASDIYAFGIIISELLSRKVPFQEHKMPFMSQIEDLIINGVRPSIPKSSPPELASLMKACLEANPAKRPSIQVIMDQLKKIKDMYKNASIPQIPQNIFDDAEFFRNYMEDQNYQSMVENIEKPCIESLLKSIDLKGTKILDIGCGTGKDIEFLINEGVSEVIAIDPSSNMISLAKQNLENFENIQIHQTFVESFNAIEPEYVDVVIARLSLHYVWDLFTVIGKISKWLEKGGVFVFSIDHPCISACSGIMEPEADADGYILQYPLDNYFDEGLRSSKWYVHGVRKYHRTLDSLILMLLKNKFQIGALREPYPSNAAIVNDRKLQEYKRKPAFLCIAATKPC